ncbi:DUF7519 family protein [Natronolimnobius baerhuensis]|uniref:Uncharacterized protein n=1 Tax=Natronolimnobius baerhuensis TaxID=253108 RepID=A0A202E622_9EURY|nr:hypothetical protein [Natronolimnobius baerhuensis]OVE83711.1 hypothetical protein B2G88_14890 [Natronolimnobius baerhuensis]
MARTHDSAGGPSGDSQQAPEPETVSAPVTAVTTILATLAGIALLAVGGDPVAGLLAVVTGGLLTATVTATKRGTPGGRGLGSILAVITALALTGALALAATSGPLTDGLLARVGLIVAMSLATFGATATVTGAVGSGAVRSAFPVTILTALPLSVVAIAYLEAVRSRVDDALGAATDGPTGGASITDPILSPDGTVPALVSFVALAVAVLWVSAFVLPRLPIAELVTRENREQTRHSINRTAKLAGLGGLLLIPTSFGLAATAALSRTGELPPVVASTLETWLLPVTMMTGVRVGILAAIATLLALLALAWLPGLYRLRYHPFVAWAPVFSGGALVSVLLVVGYPAAFERWIQPALEEATAEGGTLALPGFGELIPIAELTDVLEPPNGIALLAIAMLSLIGTITAVLVGIWLLGSIGPLPDRGAPGSLGAGALVFGAIIAGVDGASVLVVSGVVACALVTWDGAVYGVSVTEELGRETSVRRPALAHTTGSVLVGLVAVALVAALPRVLEGVAVSTGITVATSLIIALVLSFVLLKRWAGSEYKTPPSDSLNAGSSGPNNDGTTARERREQQN